jgi:hypothetical protein
MSQTGFPWFPATITLDTYNEYVEEVRLLKTERKKERKKEFLFI